MHIVHRAGCVHSNVDPISRLRRRVLNETGPVSDTMQSINLGKEDEADPMRSLYEKFGFRFEEKLLSVGKKHIQNEVEASSGEPTTVSMDVDIEGSTDEILASTRFVTAQNYSVLINVASEELTRWRNAYQQDPHFRDVISSMQDFGVHQRPRYPQYMYGDDGLIFFEDANGNNRLCVPKPLRVELMTQVHDSLTESAHAGYHQCYNRLASTHYWPGIEIGTSYSNLESS